VAESEVSLKVRVNVRDTVKFKNKMVISIWASMVSASGRSAILH